MAERVGPSLLRHNANEYTARLSFPSHRRIDPPDHNLPSVHRYARRARRAIRRSVLFSVLLALLMPLPQTGAEEPAPVDPRALTFDAVPFVPREPDRVVFDNGMVVFLLEDHELPLITIGALLRTGSWLDPPDKVGLAALTGTVMRTGGAAGIPAEAVDEALRELAAHVSIGIGRQFGSASLDVLKKDFKPALHIFARLLRTPSFDSAGVELAKLQAGERIRRRHDDPESLANREFVKALYGPAHPAAREASLESVERITREDLISFHGNTIHPNGMILGVAGDFSKDEMVATLREAFGDWEMGTVPDVAIPEVPDGEGSRVIQFVNKDLSQTHLRMGHLSIKENDADYAPLAIANDILGGDSYRGRLYNEVRTKRGLAYSVGSELNAGTRQQGVWLLWAETKLPSTTEVLGQFMANIERMRTELVSDAELAISKEAYLNSFVFDFSSSSQIINHAMELEYDGLPKDFFQQLREAVVKVSKQDVLAAAKKHLVPDRVKIVAVGSGRILSNTLSAFGHVREIKFNSDR
jgi:predicted Zn-dependent peptidase